MVGPEGIEPPTRGLTGNRPSDANRRCDISKGKEKTLSPLGCRGATEQKTRLSLVVGINRTEKGAKYRIALSVWRRRGPAPTPFTFEKFPCSIRVSAIATLAPADAYEESWVKRGQAVSHRAHGGIRGSVTPAPGPRSAQRKISRLL